MENKDLKKLRTFIKKKYKRYSDKEDLVSFVIHLIQELEDDSITLRKVENVLLHMPVDIDELIEEGRYDPL